MNIQADPKKHLPKSKFIDRTSLINKNLRLYLYI